MEVMAVGIITCKIIYGAVRRWEWLSWKKNKMDREKGKSKYLKVGKTYKQIRDLEF